MSVLIENMDMPNSCTECVFADDENSFCHAASNYYCWNGKPKWCPLEEPVDIGYLHDWYQSSVDGTPEWTDEHLEELMYDFYLIPKQVE